MDTKSKNKEYPKLLIDGKLYDRSTMVSEMDWGIEPYVCYCEYEGDNCDGCRRQGRARTYLHRLEQLGFDISELK